ncbi:MAG: 2,3-bisphosphoglycerate-independent phosphoglycerate mutase [Oscillospiraceae bacterium]|nr:2,3-bisphosphoglycerate-independent phosphoglycerate mutase [Oscillospiraceae bacterium]
MLKHILIIGDGMADNPVPELGNITPLEKANIPVMDALAKSGVLGRAYNVPEGLPAGSDTAILSIFACDPRSCYTGRAPLEAAASGIALVPGDAAYRCNMVTFEDIDAPLEEKRIISHSAGSIEGEESIEIINALFAIPEFAAAAEKAGIVVHPSPSFRHMAVQSAADIEGIRLIPPHDHLGEKAGQHLPSGCANAEVLKELMLLAHRLLDKHPLNESRRARGKLPANGIWFWAEGTAVALPRFTDRYSTGGVISAVPLCHGIARLAGLEPVEVEGATGEIVTNYEGKAAAALAVLENHDFAAVHLEAPDECTHNGDLEGKISSIEQLDSRIIAPLVEGLKNRGWDWRMLVISDHKTLTSTRGHDGDCVPFILYDSRKSQGSGLEYNEKNGLKGPTVSDGSRLMDLLFEK